MVELGNGQHQLALFVLVFSFLHLDVVLDDYLFPAELLMQPYLLSLLQLLYHGIVLMYLVIEFCQDSEMPLLLSPLV